MYRRSYEPTYDPIACLAIETHLTRYKYCVDNKKIKADRKYWFAINNDQPYDRAKENSWQGEQLTYFEKKQEQNKQKMMELGTIISIHNGRGHGVIFNQFSEMSVKGIRHFHILINKEKSD